MSVTFKSVLSAIGSFLKKVFSPQAVAFEASIVDIALPQFAALTNATASAIINAENASIAAGVQSGSGAQKAAIVVSAIEKQYTDFATANSIPVIPANVKNYVDAIVAALNSFPAPTTPVTATSTTASAVTSVTEQAKSGTLL